MDTSTSPAASALDELVRNLAHVDGFSDDVRQCLGLTPDAALTGAPLQALYADLADPLSLYLLSGGALTIYQRATNGQTLTITVPVARVARTTFGTGGGGATLTLELDADQTTTELEAEYLEGPGDQDAQRRGRQLSRSVTRRSGYTLTGEGDAAVAKLRGFHRQLQAAVHA